ncbi:hypothetical protein DWB84_06595 [Saccharophagus sp. K07]|uniref:hypothetical protein n=1 Tax=Saccharophagus sp. K07 TaxID=2283636 RepID=UPI001652AFF5|nr:hypothetical protein [Saccharophagus sp. K07]MBC6905129.1 hypothetical protein [Saccharophagus sp. K07]
MSLYKDYPTIAGAAAGRRVTIHPGLHNTYRRLEQAALRGNHWARIAVKELQALTTGLQGKNNVYCRPFGSPKNAVGEQAFYVFLPGLKATVYPGIVGQYHVTELVLDANYYEATEEIRDQTRMGLYRARFDTENNAWRTKYVEGGKVASQEGHLVAVADSGYKSADHAARNVMPQAIKHLGIAAANTRNRENDLHFTPGKKSLGGMIRYNALKENSSRASALHLAASMAQAKNTKGVIWMADKGGSVVLTQAMQILVDKGITLKGHTAYLYHPRTSPGDALRLAHKLELTLNESFADTGWDLQGAVSQLSVAGLRLKNSDDPYNTGYHAQAWINGLVKAAGPVGLAGAGAAAMGVSMPMLGGIVAAISGGGVVYALGQSLVEDLRHKFKR